jgi:hypothetical protein
LRRRLLLSPRAAADLDRQVLDRILSLFEDVGRTKAVGYLPIYTINDVLKETIDRRAEALTARGLNVRVFNEGETCIKSGAVFAYDSEMMSRIIDKHRDALANKDWAPAPDYVVNRISIEWYEQDDPIMPFIRDLYNDK